MRVSEVIQDYLQTWLSIFIGWLVAWFGYDHFLSSFSIFSAAFDYFFEVMSKAFVAAISGISAYLGVHYIKKILKHK